MSTRVRPPDDFDREIRAHLELEAEQLVEDGMDPAAARDAARRAFGNVATARERFYEAGRLLWLDRLGQDVRCAMRNLRRAPIAALVAIASLAAGIGATTVTLTVRNVVFRNPPLLYADPGQLSKVQVGRPDRPLMSLGGAVPAPLFLAWREALGPAIAGSAGGRGVRDVRLGERVETAPLRTVTPEFFALIGVNPALGRLDVTPGAGPTPAVLSYQLWQRLFDGRPDVIGQVIWIDKDPHTIAGVLPAPFWFGDMNSPVWTALDPRTLPPGDTIETIVRRPGGESPAMLDARLRTALAEYEARLPAGERNLRLKVSKVEGTPIGHQVALILPYLLGTSVLLTLLIACANVAILMIAQWTAREHEIAIRASIGGSRARIIRSLLTESVLVAAIGGALGVCVTLALRGWIVHRAGAGAGFFNLAIDPAIFVQTAVITLLTGIAAGIAPALYETRRLHVNPLRAIAGSDRVRQRWRNALVVFEITVTVALLVETTSMIDGYQRAANAQMGFATRPLLTARIENAAGVNTPQVLDALARLPGVAAAAGATTLPYAGGGPRVPVSADGSGSGAVLTERSAITAGFFSTLGVQMRTGRPFSTHDQGPVAIVNEALARRLFQGREPLGNRVWIGGTPYDLIGVVANYSSNPLRPADLDARVFVPLPAQSKEITRLSFLIRAEGDPAPLTQTIRPHVRDALTGTIVTQAYTMDQIQRIIGQELLVGTAPLFPLIAIGMLLTMAGIYGVLAFAITRRSRELAVRVAVGASGRDLVRLVSAHTIRLVAVGAGAGIAATFALSRVVRASGGAGSVWDPGVQAFVIPVLVVLAIGAIATWIPSCRALKINPADLLRTT
jgi:putative ABC transport system permease protein